MIRKVLAGICAFSLMYSCNKEDDVLSAGDPIADGEPVAATFVSTLVKQDWAMSDSANVNSPETRVKENQWTNGDRVGIYMIKESDNHDLTKALYQNRQYTVNATTGKVTHVANADKMYYPINSETKVQFVAYFPYDAGATFDNKVMIDNFANQESSDNIEDIDFVFSKGSKSYNRPGTAIQLENFKHKFSKIRIHVLQADGGPSCANLDPTLIDMPTSAMVDLAALANEDEDDAITPSIPGEIKPRTISSETTKAIFEAIVPPHKGSDFAGREFQFNVGGDEYIYPLPDTFEFRPGMAHKFELTIDAGAPVNSHDGLNNCFLVGQNKTSDPIEITRAYTIGGMPTPADDAKLEILWDDNGVISGTPKFTEGSGASRKFTVTTTSHLGNAVIALKRGSTIYWSWHIWVTQQPVSEFTNNGYTFMDRNLGATENANSLQGRGLFYQWGRKDPFPPAMAKASVVSQFNGLLGTPIRVRTENRNAFGVAKGMQESIRNPTTFFSSKNLADWLPNNENTLWNTTKDKKSVYDPCPNGWRVPKRKGPESANPPVDGHNPLYHANGYTLYNEKQDNAYYSCPGLSGQIFPAGGYIVDGGTYDGVGRAALHWTTSPDNYIAWYMGREPKDNPKWAGRSFRVAGLSIRCTRE
jgi:hypothetical protein